MCIKLIIDITNPLASLSYHLQSTYLFMQIDIWFCLYFDVQKCYEIAVKTTKCHYHKCWSLQALQ